MRDAYRSHKRNRRSNKAPGISLKHRRLACEPLEDRQMLSIGGSPDLQDLELAAPRPDQFDSQSAHVDGAEGVTNGSAERPPLAPSNLSATATSSGIHLTWTDNSDNEAGFIIQRRRWRGSVHWTDWREIGRTDAGGTTLLDSYDLSPDTTYSYRMSTYNDADAARADNEAGVTTPPLAAPSNLLANVVSSSQIDLMWEDNSTTENSFIIDRKFGRQGTWHSLASVGQNVTTYSDEGLTPNTACYYRVRSYSLANLSEPTNEVSRTTLPEGNIPLAPSGLALEVISSSQIDLTWNDNSDNETGFIIERKIGRLGTWWKLDTVEADATTYSNTGLPPITACYYRVRAHNALGASEPSGEASATTPLTEAIPVAPSNLSLHVISSSRIDLAWTDNSSDETGFIIERKIGRLGTWWEIDTVEAEVTAYSNTGLPPSTSCYYRVRANNPAGVSDPSNEENATTPYSSLFPNAPVNLSLDVVSPSEIELAWMDNSDNENGFIIQRTTYRNWGWAQIDRVDAGVTTYRDLSALEPDTTYFYRVLAFNYEAGHSRPSNMAETTTRPLAAPSDLSTRVVSSSQIDLTWTDNSHNETHFFVERKFGQGGTWHAIAMGSENVTTYSDRSVPPETACYYRVRSYRTSDLSEASNEASATTPPEGTLPLAPSNLSLDVVSSSQIDLAWTDNSDNETHFYVERKFGRLGNWHAIALAAANSTTYSDETAPPETACYYRVRAYNRPKLSASTNEANATTPTREGIYVEAELGAIVAPMLIGTNPTASGSEFVWMPTGSDGSASYTFTVEEAGDYALWGRVNTMQVLADSFLMQWDDMPPALWDLPLSSDWIWDRVSHRDAGDRLYSLSAGEHTLTISPLANGAQLDQLLLTRNTELSAIDTAFMNEEEWES